MLPFAISADDLTGTSDSVFMQAMKHSAYQRIASTQNPVEAFSLAINMAENRK